MKVASVGFHWGVSQVGGAQVPSVAFHDWCKILGHDCDILNFTKSGKPSINIVTNCLLNPKFSIKTFKLKDMVDVLNSYDFIFLGTPGPSKSPDFPSEEDWSKIVKPYVTMIHAEFDNVRLYDPNRVNFLINNSNCKALIVIDYLLEYWKKLTDKKQIFWHPCTLPEYLVKESDVDQICTTRKDLRFGLVYAARLESWKNPELLAKLTHDNEFMRYVDGDVDVYGVTNIWHIEEKINQHHPRWNRHNETHLIYNYDKSINKFNTHKFFWDVCGNSRYKLPIPRLNLASFEAMKGGCIVLADHRYVQPYCRDFTINFSRDEIMEKGLSESQSIKNLGNVYADYYNYQKTYLTNLAKSPVGYEAMKKSIIEILNS